MGKEVAVIVGKSIHRTKLLSRRLLLMLVILLFSMAPCCSEPLSFELGIYLASLYDLDFVENSFTTDFWVWGRYPLEEIDWTDRLDIVNAKTVISSLLACDERGDRMWMQRKLHGVVRHEWDMRYFPFNHEVLNIAIEDNFDISEILFTPDTLNSCTVMFDDELEWRIEDFRLDVSEHVYPMNYGDPYLDGQESIFSRITVYITIVRKNPWVAFTKYVGCVYISFLLSLLAFWMKPNTDSRLAMPSASVFAIVSNKYIVDSSIPSSESLTLMDQIHITTLLAVFCICAVVIYSDGLRATGDLRDLRRSRWVDRVACCCILVVYIFLNWMFLIEAVRH